MRPFLPGRARGLAAVAGVALVGCIPSNLVAEQDRVVASTVEPTGWDAPLPASLEGLWESVSIRGAIAGALWQVYYHFEPDGLFTGAALVAGDPPRFQVLSGTYRIEGDRIELGEGSPSARLSAAPEHLRLETEGEVVVLRRVPGR